MERAGRFVQIFFREERLPVAEGWTRSPTLITSASMGPMSRIIGAAAVWTATQACEPLSPGTHLSDILSNSARLRDANEPPFIRRGVAVTNIPPGTTAQQLLDLVHTGALEYLELSKDGTRADLSFVHGYSAARFVSAPPALLGNKLRCTWLLYRPLDPVVAVAFERDRARRTLLLCKKHEREGSWAARRLQRYLKGVLERVMVHEVRDPKLKGMYREVAEARFCDIASAIRAHARLSADPFMISVHIVYGADPCGFPSPYSPSSDSDYFETLTAEPRHPPP
ncbi:hypothetical protein B0H14DRAFT_3467395 [Mycena olivaceomarginata]|nr:hypothetical protein B0H14DRAFT_3467395 [Mycena olivaceomarginata]